MDRKHFAKTGTSLITVLLKIALCLRHVFTLYL